MRKAAWFLNRSWAVWFLMLALLVYIAASVEASIAWLFWSLAVVTLCLSLILPFVYCIDENGIRLYYLPFRKAEYCWSRIANVELQYGADARGGALWLLDSFVITGVPEGKEHFHMVAEISRTWRGKRLIEFYSGHKIDGYLLEDVKELYAKSTRNRKPRRLETAAVAKAEREARASVRQWMHSLANEDCKITYWYRTKNGEFSKRPQEHFTYFARMRDKQGEIYIPLLTAKRYRYRYKIRILHDFQNKTS